MLLINVYMVTSACILLGSYIIYENNSKFIIKTKFQIACNYWAREGL